MPMAEADEGGEARACERVGTVTLAAFSHRTKCKNQTERRETSTTDKQSSSRVRLYKHIHCISIYIRISPKRVSIRITKNQLA